MASDASWVLDEPSRLRESAPQLELLKGESAPVFEDLLAGASVKVRAIALRLREILREEYPKATEAIYLGWRLVMYSVREDIAGIQIHRNHCSLYFSRGVELEDEDELLEGKGLRLRHVRIEDTRGFQEAVLRKLLRRASALAAAED